MYRSIILCTFILNKITMRKSKIITLSTIFAAALLSCNSGEDQWISTKGKDTVVRGNPYRYYNGAYYPVRNGLINPGRYNGASFHEISSPSFHPSVRTGGFGSSAHSFSSSHFSMG